MTTTSILIVEDSAPDRLLYRHCLTRSAAGDFRIREVESVEGALAALAEEPADCILLDYLLPDGTGLDLIEALRANHGSLPHPVVMLTGEGSEAVAVRAMKAGVLDYAVKGSVSAESLTRAIRNALDKSKLQQELARRAEELEQLAYVVSHDLRAPLRTVHQNAELLKRAAGASLDDGAARHLERVLTGTRRMESLIVALVDYCRVGGERAFEAVELGALVEQVLSDLEAEIVDCGAELEVGPLPVVWGDPVRLRQLFQNLIGNALKFHRVDAAPRVVVDAQRAGEGWRVAVSDNGIGIDPQYTDRIFGVFQRLSTDVPGTGIGLAICRRIVEHHGGRIEVESRPGAGTCFSFDLSDADPPSKPGDAI